MLWQKRWIGLLQPSLLPPLSDAHIFLLLSLRPHGLAHLLLSPGQFHRLSYLAWKDFRFGSDSILVSFRYEKYREMIEKIEKAVPDYRAFVEDYIRKFYTIGGMIVFPKHAGSINQIKGTNPQIKDRWDLTLECIRRYYQGEESPLYRTLCRDKDFFNLFVDFRGYVDFFYLQDCVSEDYSTVKFWIGNGNFEEDPLPRSVDEYLRWIGAEMEFLNKRNVRIANAN